MNMMRSISVLLLFSATAILYMFSKKETKSRRVAPKVGEKVARTESDILGVKAANHTNAPITLFWHVRNVDDVVLDQLDHLLGSWAYRERHLKVKWSAAEDIGFANMPSKKIFKKLHKLNPSRFEPIQWNEDLFPKGGTPCLWSGAEQYGCNGGTAEMYEMPTLYALHEYCSASTKINPGRSSEFVAYMHSKTDKHWRDDMMHHLLSEPAVNSCIDNCLASGNVACGSRFHPAGSGPCPGNNLVATWCHFSGNFWWARCDYVAKLNPPWASSLPKEFSIDGLPMSPALSDRPYGRYFAEWWLLNDLAEAFWTFPVLHRERDTWKMGSQNDTATAVRQAHLIEPSGCERPKEPMLTKYGKLVKEKEWPALCPASEGNYSICHTSLIEPG
mmetsp:Transcript_17725/g.36301  ORF Transcript_17725/g.36301 Transcript_17725/m.36301 type:complete len:388 (-) Transcript_17725:278-1441(-)